MSLLGDLRLDVGDDNISASASGQITQVASSNVNVLLRHLRLDIGDDINLVTSTGVITYTDFEADTLLIHEELHLCGALYVKARIVTSEPITILPDDNIILINKTVAGPTLVTLPLSDNGICATRNLIIKDVKGDAATNNITVIPASGLIDGQISVLLNNNYQSYTFIRNQEGWSAI